MHKCNNCGEEFEGNFCPNCGAPVSTYHEKRTVSPVPVKTKSPTKKILAIVLPLLFVAISVIFIVALAQLNVFRSCTNYVNDKKHASDIQKIELGDSASKVSDLLGEPDEKRNVIWLYYGGEYKSLLKQQQNLLNKLETTDDEELIDKIFDQIEEIDEKLVTLEYSYTSVWFDADNKVFAVIHDTKRKTNEVNFNKSISSYNIFPSSISIFSDPYSFIYSAKEEYTDGSYYCGFVSPDTSNINSFKTGSYSATWKSYFSSSTCYGSIKVTDIVVAGTEFSGTIGNHSFNAKITKNCKLDDLELNISVEGEDNLFKYNKNADTYWAKVRPYATSISLPDSVTSIDASALRYCGRLASITVSANVTNCKSVNNCLLSLDGTTLIFGCKNSIIPDSVKYIGESAFEGCTGLTSITIPDGVTSICEDAFYGCSGLTSVNISNSVTSIGRSAFSGCPIETAAIPVFAVKSVMNSKLKKIIMTSGNKIDNNTFYGCSGLTSITIPNSVTSIGDAAFYGCSGLTSITIPNSVMRIGSVAFSECSGLKSITIPNSVTSIGVRAFINCNKLTINCEAASKPTGWEYDWNYSNRPVNWGYKG